MYVGRSEWKSPEANEYVGISKNEDKLIDKVIAWAEGAEADGYVTFSKYPTREDKVKAIKESGGLESDGAYRDGTVYEKDDWVCYFVDNVEDIDEEEEIDR